MFLSLMEFPKIKHLSFAFLSKNTFRHLKAVLHRVVEQSSKFPLLMTSQFSSKIFTLSKTVVGNFIIKMILLQGHWKSWILKIKTRGTLVELEIFSNCYLLPQQSWALLSLKSWLYTPYQGSSLTCIIKFVKIHGFFYKNVSHASSTRLSQEFT